MTRNVYYGNKPEKAYVLKVANTNTCYVELPVNVEEIPGDGERDTQWKSDVYSIRTLYKESLLEEVLSNYDAWLERAKEESIPEVTIDDVMETVNLLTSIVLGGV